MPKLTYPQQVIFRKFLDEFIDEDIIELWKEITKFYLYDDGIESDEVEVIEDTRT